MPRTKKEEVDMSIKIEKKTKQENSRAKSWKESAGAVRTMNEVLGCIHAKEKYSGLKA